MSNNDSYDNLLTKKLNRSDPQYRECLAPDCPSGQIHAGEGNVFVCTACGHHQCTVHNAPFHEDLTCEEYDAQRQSAYTEDDFKSRREVAKTSVKCPGLHCGLDLEKEGGCDHVTCKQYPASEYGWQHFCLPLYRRYSV